MSWDPANLRRLNLNLLHALGAILRAPTLTEAGRMISLSQPAMSMALRRLRDNFDDPLVVYGHGGRRLTALGEALAPRVMRIMREAGDVLDLRLAFDPATADRIFSIAVAQDIELMLLRIVVPRLLEQGPGLRFDLVPLGDGPVQSLFERGVDIAILPERMADPVLPMQRLFELSQSAIVCRDHPRFGVRMTASDYLDARHVALFEAMEHADHRAGHRDILTRRDVVVRTSSCAMLPALVERTDLVATMNAWLAQSYAATMPVRVVEVDATFPVTPMAAQWPSHLDGAPHIAWLIDALRDGVMWGS